MRKEAEEMLRAGALAGLLLACLGLQGCILFVAAPFMIQNEFNEKRAALKDQVEKGTVPREAGEAECVRMLGQVGRGMTAPPPISPDVCKFGSFADKRYELTLLVQKGTLTPDSWERECNALRDKPAVGEPCKYDPVGQQVVEWKRLIADGRTTKEAVEYDCQKVVSAANSTDKHRVRNAQDVCQF